ncbi:MAG TPA: ROK family protein [Bryobacteraceae bacterium]|nr:ROK family protein [Bryobacteraceae bacterium]
MPSYSIGVDLGGTNLRAAAVSERGVIFETISGRTAIQEGPAAVVADMVASIEELRRRMQGQTLAGVGIGVPGFIRLETGIIARWGNAPAFNGYPIRDQIEQMLGYKVILENDANAAALGEKWVGAGQNVNDLVLLTLGTGIGGGIISGGRILHGFLGMAGEIGHLTISPNGNPCGCGNNGCLEKHASATAIAAMGRLLNLGQGLTSRDVYQLAVEGSDRARAVFRTMGEALGIALASLVNIFNFPLYLLSGGPLPAWEFFAPAMLREVERRSLTYRTAPTRIEPAKLGSEAGLYGAAYLPFQSVSGSSGAGTL